MLGLYRRPCEKKTANLIKFWILVAPVPMFIDYVQVCHAELCTDGILFVSSCQFLPGSFDNEGEKPQIWPHFQLRHFWRHHPLPSNRHHQSNGDCFEGKMENYQVFSVQYSATIVHSAMHTHMNRPNSSLDWVLSHWAHFTVLRFISVHVLCITVYCMHV